MCLNVNLGYHRSILIRCSDRVVTIHEYGHASNAKCNTAPREILDVFLSSASDRFLHSFEGSNKVTKTSGDTRKLLYMRLNTAWLLHIDQPGTYTAQ